MTKTIGAEFYALYKYKQVLESCARLASGIHDDAEHLNSKKSDLPQLPNAAKLHTAWELAYKARKSEAATVLRELETAAEALSSVAELYGWTDAELARQVAVADKHR